MLKGLIPSLLVLAALIAIFVAVVSAQGTSTATTASALQISAAESEGAPSGCQSVDCDNAEVAGVCPPDCILLPLFTPTPTFELFIIPCIIFDNCPTPTPTFELFIIPCIIFDSCPTPTPTLSLVPICPPLCIEELATDTPTAVAEATDTPVPPKGSILGDVDCSGTVNAIDAAFILQLGAGLIDELPCPAKADVNEDGMANAVDATLILQLSAGFFDSLPV